VALIYTLSTEHVYYSHEVRAYSLLSLLTALAVDRYLDLIKEPGRWRHYVWLGLWCSLLIYTHFLGIWVLVAIAVGWLLLPQKKVTFIRLALMFLGVVLVYSPNLYAFYLRLGSVAAKGTWVDPPIWTQLYGHINGFLNGRIGTVGVLVAIGIGIVSYVMMKARQVRTMRAGHILSDHAFIICLAFFLITYIGIYIQSLVFTPAFIPRYLVFTSIPLYVVIARLLTLLFQEVRWSLIAFGIVFLGMAWGFTLNPGNHRKISDLAHFVAAEKARTNADERSPQTPILISPPYFDLTFYYHYDLKLFRDYDHRLPDWDSSAIYPVVYWEDVPVEVPMADRIIYVDADAQFVGMGYRIVDNLKKHYRSMEKRTFEENLDVYVFSR
jgi:hypothetical protein